MLGCTLNENIQMSISDRPVDMLGRQEIVDQIMNLINIISDNNGSCTFALNGRWGVGKTFVLNMLEENLVIYQGGTKYLIFHYNCWKYDYYEEPLFAIVAALLEGVDEETHFFSEDARIKAQAGLRIAQPVLKEIAAAILKAKLGTDFAEVFERVAEGRAIFEQTRDMEHQKKEYDPYLSFNSILRYTQGKLQELAKDRTVVVVVDELDRCLPTYAIKVLERLHHLFYGMKNCVVAMAVAKDQLQHTIKQVFGNEIDTEQYLKKFFDYQMDLEIGTIQGAFSEKYSDYFSMFDKTILDTEFDVDEFCAALFDNLNPRIQERMMERIKTIHKILIPNVIKDYSFLCFEMLWVVLSHYELLGEMPMFIDGGEVHIIEKRNSTITMNAFSKYLEEKWGYLPMQPSGYSSGSGDAYVFSNPIGIPQLMFWYLGAMFTYKPVIYQLYDDTPHLEEFKLNSKELKRFCELFKIIK